MGFPPIGIMSLSSVIKQAGHECVMFDQANPDTPNSVIIDRINREQPALVGLSFLSTTSYPYAKMLAREIRATNQKVKLAFGGVFASLNAPLVKLQCPEVDFVCRGDGEQLLLDLLANFHIGPHSDILLGYSILFPGSFIERTATGGLANSFRTQDLFYAQYSFRW